LNSDPSSALEQPQSLRVRVESVDVLRGLVVVIMALDHTREFFSSFGGNPTDPATASGFMFFTRWITHLCAPTFVFLAGTSIYLQSLRKPRPQLARFLVSRGLWLMVLELVVVSSMLTFHPSPHFFLFQVIWVTGLSMVLMAALIYLPLWVVGLFGAVLVLGHNAFDSVSPAAMAPMAGMLWRLLHVPGPLISPSSGYLWLNLYPLIPWPGIMALGFVFGRVLQQTSGKRERSILLLGIGAIALFAIVRFTNSYGDAFHRKPQSSELRTFLSFINVQKYPPSLLFALVTLGLALCLMALFDRWQARDKFKPARAILSVYGRVPFFYYLLHFTTIHLAALLTTAAMGLDWRWWFQLPPGGVIAGHPPGFGFSLPIVYLVWLVIVAFCYFPCRWYASMKQHSRSPWLSYL
jgi:uncharacterized membrane protein